MAFFFFLLGQIRVKALFSAQNTWHFLGAQQTEAANSVSLLWKQTK